jgi:hypothetical protein
MAQDGNRTGSVWLNNNVKRNVFLRAGHAFGIFDGSLEAG